MVTLGAFWSIYNRMPLAMDVIRDRNTLFRETDRGMIENVYTLKIINMTGQAHSYSLSVSGIPGASLLLDTIDIVVDSGEVIEEAVRVSVDPDQLSDRSTEIEFHLTATDSEDLYVTEEARFLGPRPAR
jgi:polyferredoxin